MLDSIADGVIVTDPGGRVMYRNPAAESVGPEVEETTAPLRGDSGKIEGEILILRDTTRRRESEAQLGRSQKLDALARLAGGVAGDFNNLLTVISGYSDMLRAELAPLSPLRRYADEIVFASERAAAVTRHLMAFSRLHTPQTRVMDLNAALAGMETMLTRLLGEGISLVSMPAPGILRIRADPGQIEQVLVNLAMNSRDAMPNGGKVVIETSSVDLTAEATGRPQSLAPGAYALLTVSDTGIGMDTDTMSRLFEPFFTTKTRGRSTGLGLSIVYGIVRQAGGDIGVYSRPGAGTIFEIYLPKSPADNKALGRGPRGPGGTETILVADDDEGVRKLVHAVLTTRGYTVMEASDGAQAWEVYAAEPEGFEMVLTDVVMPLMNGFELGNRIAELRPGQRVLYMSGFRDTQPAGGEQERPRLFLHKPFTPDVLLVRVRELLDSRVE
jgi:signal transduction histidine kinase